LNNAELLVRGLERMGVRWVFGVPSGPVLPLIEALRRSQTVDFVLTATETSAGFMAEAVGRLTGVPGVCVSTVGPGATNLVTGVGGAWLDRSPVIAITATYPTRQLERRTQMLIDHRALFAPLTKGSERLAAGSVAAGLERAASLATSEPPGPVFLELPEDVAVAEATETDAPLPKPAPQRGAPDDVAERVGALLEGARHPLVVAGLTFTRAHQRELLARFCQRHAIPFVTTLHAKGFIPESLPGALGVMGRARRTDVARAIAGADLILAVGFDPVEIDYEDWASATPVAHLSTEPVQAGTGITLAYQAVGGMDALLEALDAIPARENGWDQAEWAAHREALDGALRPAITGFAAHQALDVLRERLPADAILAYDVGAHTHQIATQWRTDLPHTAVATNGWSSMGYGMPAAYAAKLVHPERTVVGVVGDGCFQMTAGELATAARLGLRVPLVVLDDGWLGLMKLKQERGGYGHSGVVLGERVPPPAHYFGVPVRAAHDPSSFAEALEWALAQEGPSVIQAVIDVEGYSATVFD
jgi:acetolactate synthase-1/2/3 large subunit